ncbi:aspartic peptidase A1 [Russula dissimulans]|nr:aspartic peptidase A1 [Russula dissimulans]
MFPIAPSVLLILLALSVRAKPIVIRQAPVTLSFARKLNITGSNDLVLKDQARAKSLLVSQNGTGTPDAVVNLTVTNVAVNYHTVVGIGNPATYCGSLLSWFESALGSISPGGLDTLIIDTGSANTWAGAEKAYVKTGTSVQTDNNVSVSYASASFSGTEFMDTVTITPSVIISSQSIGVASTIRGIRGADGILGLGPTNLTIGSLSPSKSDHIPTVTDNLFNQGAISSNLVSVSFEPTNGTLDKNGELMFGDTDSTKFTGNITFIPLTRTYPASSFWGISQSIQYGASIPILNTTAGVVDTGTTLILLATDAFDRYRAATGAVPDNTTGLLRITPAQYSNLQSLFFTAGDTTFELTPNAQIWPRVLNSFIGGTPGDVYLIVHDIGGPSGRGLDFINGCTFLERFYSVFDTENRQVGLATTPFTTATSN